MWFSAVLCLDPMGLSRAGRYIDDDMTSSINVRLNVYAPKAEKNSNTQLNLKACICSNGSGCELTRTVCYWLMSFGHVTLNSDPV